MRWWWWGEQPSCISFLVINIPLPTHTVLNSHLRHLPPAASYFVKVGDPNGLCGDPRRIGGNAWSLSSVKSFGSSGVVGRQPGYEQYPFHPWSFLPENLKIVMAHYTMESWTGSQNVTPTLLRLDLITTAMHRCACLTTEQDFPLHWWWWWSSS